MGLFGKKKELPFPSQPGTSTGQMDLSKLMAEIPAPPPEFSSNQPPMSEMPMSPAEQPELPPFEMPGIPQIPPPPAETGAEKKMPIPQQEELPVFDMNHQPAQQETPEAPAEAATPQPAQPVAEAFELPDFEDEEIAALENVKLQESEPVQPVMEKKPLTKKPFKEVKEITYPEQEKPVLSYKPKFMELERYSFIKEELEETRKLAAGTEDLVEQYAVTSKDKQNRYHALSEQLNLLQEKIMLIDTKLFESPE
ncbi:hypothetical protein JW756_02405 [Candidatus Woesearchaeota archaeon]|nr:hypothetical protein [Candidatus Woesearchaeota archaeon]